MRNFKPAQIVDRADLFAEPAAHLAIGVAGRKREDVVLLVELVHQVEAAALEIPGVLHARIEPERDRATERERRVLAEIIVGRGVAHLDGAGGDGVGGLQRRHDLAGGEHLDLEFVVGRFRHRLGKGLGRAIERIERLRKARGQPPFDLRHGLRDRGRCHRRCRHPDAGSLEEFATLHDAISCCTEALHCLPRLSDAIGAAVRTARSAAQSAARSPPDHASITILGAARPAAAPASWSRTSAAMSR